MNAFYIFLFVIIIGIFIGIFYSTQKDSISKVSLQQDQTQVLPSGSDILQIISKPPPQNQTPQEQIVVPTFGVEEGVDASYSATISTTKGNIEITLDGTDAPRTVKNFISKAKSGFYKNLTFHRVEDWVIQGGDPKGNGTGGGLMRTELNPVPFTTGSLGIARGGDINVSNDSQFFITKKEAPWLSGQYTNFGTVTSGMDIVYKIEIGDKILRITIN